MEKRGQITVYIVLGIIILISFLLYDFLAQETVQAPLVFEQFGSPVTKNVDSCLKRTVEQGIIHLGLQAGFNHARYPSFDTIYGDVPYLYRGTRIMDAPSSDEELVEYIRENLDSCIDFDLFAGQGFRIEREPFVVDAVTNENNLKVDLFYPMKISKGDSTKTIDHFAYSIYLPLDDVFYIADELLAAIAFDPRYIPTSYINDLMDSFDVQIDMMTYEDTIIYIIEDKEVKISDTPYRFLFAVELDPDNKPPLLSIPDMKAIVGQEFRHELIAYDPDGDDLVFAADSTIFYLTRYTGIIIADPSPADVGFHDVNITVSDGQHNVSQVFKFEVAHG